MSGAAVTRSIGGGWGAALARAWRDEEGTVTVEYALLLALMVVATVGAWTTLGGKLKMTIDCATNELSQPLG